MPPRLPLLLRASLAAARFCISAWIGAAVLFVIVSVREVLVPEFTSEVKDRLVMSRFPAYYMAGAILVALSFVMSVVASTYRVTRGLAVALVMLLIAGGLMAADYVWIYGPLTELIIPPGQARTLAFTTLHHSSMRINTGHLAMCLIAAGGLFATDPSNRHDEPSLAA